MPASGRTRVGRRGRAARDERLTILPTAPDDDETRPGSPLGRWGLTAVVLAAVLVRGLLLAQALRSRGLDDPDNYLPLARSLAEGRGFCLDGRPTAYRPPLYPIVMAPLVAALGARAGYGVAALHLALGAGTVVLTLRAARRWGLPPGAALAAGAVVALDPVLVSQCRSVMTETLAAFLTAATLAALARPGLTGAALGGAGFGLNALCRPSALPMAALTALASLACGPGMGRARVARAAALVGATLAVLAPWAVRNAAAVGEPVWTTTHGGYTLFLANNPVYYAEVVNGPPGAVWTGPNQKRWWDEVNRSARGLSEPAADRAMRASAMNVIAAQPGDFVRASLARLGRLWGLSPAAAVYPRWLRVAAAAWTVPLWLALLAGLTAPPLWRWPRVAAPASIVALTLVHSLYWTDLRMRAPVLPAVALVAAYAPRRRRAPRSESSTATPPRGVVFAPREPEKNSKNPRILLFKFRGIVRLMSAALGGRLF